MGAGNDCGAHALCEQACGGDVMTGGGVIIVGAGLAGLFTALKLAPMPVTVISPQPLGTGASSAWAQGGIAAAVTPGDTPEAHAADTIRAGAGIVEPRIANLLAREAPARIDDLLRYGVPFDRDLEGHLMVSREAAHSARRVVRVRGDLAGKAIMEAVTAAARQAPSIRILEGVAVHALAVADGRVAGVFATPAEGDGGQASLLQARAVVLASGGIGQLYALTTNPPSARGEGIAMAASAGAVIADAEFVQFHPTALDIGRDPAPLATEALRGEGATLINRNGERFMLALHPDAELAPRDLVARAVFREIVAGRGAFLDCRKAIGARFPEAFPSVYATCREAGIDPVHEPLPVAPAEHYHMGGVLTDANGRTSVDGLWACGEVASTGAHGANRLASNSLLETVVFGARIAEDISGLAPLPPPQPLRDAAVPQSAAWGGSRAAQSLKRLRRLMTDQVGVERDRSGLESALAAIEEMLREQNTPLGLRNMLLSAKIIAAAALARQESRGAHYRTDFPAPDPAKARRSFLTLARVDAIAAACGGAGETATAASGRRAAGIGGL